MSIGPSSSVSKTGWNEFLFPVTLDSEVDADGQLLSEWIEDLDERIHKITIIAESYPSINSVLQVELQKLKDTIFECCIDFIIGSEDLHLFGTEKDVVRYLDHFYLDVLDGTCLHFYDDFYLYLQQWEDDVQSEKNRVQEEEEEHKKEKRQRPNISKEARTILSEWFKQNVTKPYPKQQEKEQLSLQTGLSLKTVDNWFINERSRKWHLYNKHSKLH